MATPVDFPEKNTVLLGDESRGIKDLPVYIAQGVQGIGDAVISCWELSPEEKEEVMKTGKLYVLITGTNHTPILVLGIPPFQTNTPTSAPPETSS